MAAVLDQLDRLEIDLCVRVNAYGRSAGIQRFFVVVSRLGDGWFWLVCGAIIFVLQGPASMWSLFVAAGTGATGLLIYKVLKKQLVRERPFINADDIHCGTAPLDRYSFPSGHTLHATSFALLFSTMEPLLLPIVAPFALLVAVSRVVLGLHYPSDVLVGAAIGVALAAGGTAWL